MKTSQLYNQLFIYILTILLSSFIIVYGYSTIQNFKQRAEQVACVKFKNDLKNAVDSILNDYGSVIRKDLLLCSGYKQICFIETFEEIDRNNLPTSDPIIKDSILSDAGRNVFFVDQVAKESFYAGNISVNPDVFCINEINNKISLRLEGKGNYVLLSE